MNALTEEQRRVDALVNKHAWILEGIQEERLRRSLAQLLENQEAYTRGLLEDTTTADLAMPQAYSVALIRKVYPALVAYRLASIQPLRGPNGKIFYLDHVREPVTTFLTAQAESGQDVIEVDSAYGLKPGDLVTIGKGDTAESRVIEAVVHKTVTLAEDLENTHPKNTPVSCAYSTAKTTEGGAVARARLSLTSMDVSAEKYALAVAWTTEAMEDLRATHNLDAEAELIDAVAGEIVREIDRAVLADMLANAGAGAVPWSATKPEGFTETEWRRTLYDAIVDANNAIFKRRYRSADFLVADPDTVGRLEKLEEFHLSTEAQPSIGVQLVGRLNNRWEVYKTADFPPNQILVGIKGDGYVYAPYVPLTLTPPHYDAATDTWTRALRTRAARQITVPEAYAVVTILPEAAGT
ncbi:MAG TPA: hypothetical protein PLY56_12070 [Armatimonadota bacterium]|jgi:hypothetical protein|nr:hypothetical protein [Armatimonadota bacterium]HOJ22263.1 hypothetical protein [Armatimonadota bacterium]HOM82918.1 hypothetical protein [Armatimonadota bacterium]HPO73914.1 hypothetical protein [Armatimonadota bacterium]